MTETLKPLYNISLHFVPHPHIFQELLWIKFLQINGDLGPCCLRYRCQY